MPVPGGGGLAGPDEEPNMTRSRWLVLVCVFVALTALVWRRTLRQAGSRGH